MNWSPRAMPPKRGGQWVPLLAAVVLIAIALSFAIFAVVRRTTERGVNPGLEPTFRGARTTYLE